MIYLIQGSSEWARPDPNDDNPRAEWIVGGTADKAAAEALLARLTERTDKLDALREQLTGTKLYDGWHKNRQANVEAELKLLYELNFSELDPNVDAGVCLSYEILEVPVIGGL